MVTQLFIKYFTRKKALSCVNDSVRLIQSFSTEVTPLDHQGNNKQAGHCTVREIDPTSVAGRSQSEVDIRVFYKKTFQQIAFPMINTHGLKVEQLTKPSNHSILSK